MISGTMHVLWLDVDSGNHHDGPLSELFGAVSHQGVRHSGPKFCIPMNDMHLKITDWRGWSDIIAIERLWNVEWWTLRTEQGKVLTCSSDTLIPVYDPTALTKGFHGESKYDVKIVAAEELKVGDYLRVRNIVDPEKSHSIDFDRVVEIGENPDYEPCLAYNVITKSGFMNCNDIYIANRIKDNSETAPCKSNCTGCKFAKNV